MQSDRDTGAAPEPERRSERTLGRYRLDERVGEGGMAVVWRAFDPQLRRTVAIKVLHAHLHGREEARRRFDREAQAIARLHHRHILEVYDFSGLESSPPFLVTEFIQGQTLRAFAEAHPFDPPELAAACLLPIAEALAHAHAAGVIHRDLKPENVMISDDGTVKLTDFGIAALLDPDEKFTVTGAILGSPSHLAPETIEGRPADPRSDLFSFGTILYWLACGQLPYAGPSPAALLRSILEGGHEDPRSLRPSVSDRLARIVARCLEREPAARYQTAGELVAALTAALSEEELTDPAVDLHSFLCGRPPEAASTALRARLVAGNLARADAARLAGRTSAALSSYGRVLTLEPTHAQARARLTAIRRRDRLKRAALRTAAAAAALVLAVVGVRALRHRPHGVEPASAQSAGALSIPGAAQAGPSAPSAQGATAGTQAATSPASGASDPVRASGQAGLPSRQVRASRAGTARKGPSSGARGSVKNQPAVVAHAAPRQRVTLRLRYPSRVSVDGRNLGTRVAFDQVLETGPHEVLVHHDCCEDRTESLQVVSGKRDYLLELGAPRAARLEFANAPPDATVLVDGSVVGTAQATLPLSMSTITRSAVITIGNRTVARTLKAGVVNRIDYNDASGP